MRYDPTGQPHPEMGDEVTAEGLQHIDNCPECKRDRFPQADLTPHIAAVDEAVKASMRQQDNPGMGIVEFLEARIAEDEREANVCLAQYRRGDGGSSRRWTRQLAECAAKRAMLAKIPRMSDVYDELGGTSHYVLQCLAAVYKDHPEYQAEWAL